MGTLSKVAALLMILLLTVSSAQLRPTSQGAHEQQQKTSEAPNPKELAIDQIKKSVVFFHTEYVQDGQSKSWDGTGFIIFESDPRLKDWGVAWLVTNKHMIRLPGRPYFDPEGR